MKVKFICAVAVLATASAFADPVLTFGEVRNVAYGEHEKNRLDIRYPSGVKGFATVVNFHGGGLVAGGRHYAPWPNERRDKDPVAFVAVSYRFLSEADPRTVIGDAAAATAWVLENISRYGGDPKKVFITGISGGGYLTAMLALDPKWLAAAGARNVDLAGAAPLTGQMTKHFNVRKVGFKDDEAQFLPKLDEWAPLAHAGPAALPPLCLLTGSRTIEWKCRVEENELLASSLVANGVKGVEFHETEGDHGGGVAPSARFLRDFVMRTVDAGGVARFAPGERIAFFGDSITHGGRYWAYLQLFAALRHPGWNVRCFNVGISGDSAHGGLHRIDWDLMSFKPDRVFSMFGMNDVYRDLWKELEPDAKTVKIRDGAIANFARNERGIVEELGRLKVKRVLVTPSPYDQYGPDARPNLPFCNDPGLARCAAAVRDLAAERHLGVVEFHRPITEIFKSRPELKMCGDRVHPNALGHVIMAAFVLEAMGEGPFVARTVIDAAKGGAARPDGKKATNADVSDLSVSADGVRFTYAPKALPWPEMPENALAEELCGFLTKFDREELVVTGLKPGRYAIAFDGTKLGEFAAADFAKGVNLAFLDTPNRRQATAALKVVQELQTLENDRRTLAEKDRQLKGQKLDLADFAAVDKWLDAYLADLERKKLPWLGYNRMATEKYRRLRTRRAELAAQADDFYERINALRPLVSRVTVLKVGE